jgi:hypothetical protein
MFPINTLEWNGRVMDEDCDCCANNGEGGQGNRAIQSKTFGPPNTLKASELLLQSNFTHCSISRAPRSGGS